MNNQNYQMWLTDRQKEILMDYIKDRRYKLMITMYCSLIASVLLMPPSVWEFHDLERQFITRHHSRGDSSGMIILLLLWSASTFLVNFVRGVGKDFWKNSDYDCLKHDSYTVDFLECTGKLPDSGNYPYFIKCADGNIYQCGMKFLEWKNFPLGEMLVCVTLRNGQKYALLPEKRF
ncbi:MAG: hypothetical protein IJ644_02445 [Oscillospiraceae bacterium]|nr:hypothetical protein [Oscillospiraceae bacterium]